MIQLKEVLKYRRRRRSRGAPPGPQVFFDFFFVLRARARWLAHDTKGIRIATAPSRLVLMWLERNSTGQRGQRTVSLMEILYGFWCSQIDTILKKSLPHAVQFDTPFKKCAANVFTRTPPFFFFEVTFFLRAAAPGVCSRARRARRAARCANC